mmetsp:Transcript_8851/g.17292  ORF Transcript_8851/g.17292 Transcript_8851/m.17292 type:complete len:381 (+) Transcript_8851:1-1143(+)
MRMSLILTNPAALDVGLDITGPPPPGNGGPTCGPAGAPCGTWRIKDMRITLFDSAGIRMNRTPTNFVGGDLLSIDNVWVEGNKEFGLQVGLNNLVQQSLKNAVIRNSTFRRNGSPDPNRGLSEILFFQTGANVLIEDTTVEGTDDPTDPLQENGIQFRNDPGLMGKIELNRVNILGTYEKVGLAFNFRGDEFGGPGLVFLQGLHTEDVNISILSTFFGLAYNIDCAASGDVDLSGIDISGSTAFDGSVPARGTATKCVNSDLPPVNWTLGGPGIQIVTPAGNDNVTFLEGADDSVVELKVPDGTTIEEVFDFWKINTEVDHKGKIVGFSSAGSTFSVGGEQSFGCVFMEGVTVLLFTMFDRTPVGTTNIEDFPTVSPVVI